MSSSFSKVCACALAWLVIASAPVDAQSASASKPSAASSGPAALTNPERDRLEITQTLSRRFPGLSAKEWPQDGAALAPIVSAIPLDADRATNTADLLAIGKKRWERNSPSGRSLAKCFGNAGKQAAASYPTFDSTTDSLVTVEAALNRCLLNNGEPAHPAGDQQLLQLTAYFRSLAVGQRVAIKVPTGTALGHYTSGRDQYTRRMGQSNFACASCHVHHAGAVYGASGFSPVIGQALAWPRIEPGGGLRSLQMQFQRCFSRMGTIAPVLGSPALDDLEYFVSYQSNGLALQEMLPTR